MALGNFKLQVCRLDCVHSTVARPFSRPDSIGHRAMDLWLWGKGGVARASGKREFRTEVRVEAARKIKGASIEWPRGLVADKVLRTLNPRVSSVALHR